MTEFIKFVVGEMYSMNNMQQECLQLTEYEVHKDDIITFVAEMSPKSIFIIQSVSLIKGNHDKIRFHKRG